MLAAVSEAEETADEGGYFSAPRPSDEPADMNGYIATSPPATGAISEPELETPRLYSPVSPTVPAPARRSPHPDPETFAEAVFFSYGVVVFFGLDEAQEHSILEDVETAEIMQKPLPEARWEIEECHYEVKSACVLQGKPTEPCYSTKRSSPTLASIMTFSVSVHATSPFLRMLTPRCSV